MGLARTSKYLLLRLIADSYVMLIRNIPPVVFVFVFVFFIASQIMPVLGIGDRVRAASPTAQWWISILFGPPKLIDNFFLGLICLSVFSGAYVTEIVRAGIESVAKNADRGRRQPRHVPDRRDFALSCCPKRCATCCRRSRASSFS